MEAPRNNTFTTPYTHLHSGCVHYKLKTHISTSNFYACYCLKFTEGVKIINPVGHTCFIIDMLSSSIYHEKIKIKNKKIKANDKRICLGIWGVFCFFFYKSNPIPCNMLPLSIHIHTNNLILAYNYCAFMS